MDMDITVDATVIVALITALAAIVAPVVTAFITSRSNLRLRKIELFESSVKPAVTQMAESYATMRDSMTQAHYWSFMAAAYGIIGQIDNPKIQDSVLQLLCEVRKLRGNTSQETDAMMDSLMISLAKGLTKQ